MSRLRSRIALFLSLALPVVAPVTAHAAGPDLDAQTAFGNYTCAFVDVAGSLLPAEWTWGITGPPRPITGCSYVATGAAAIQSPPGGGVAVAARVRVPGASTGPMRIDVLRATRSDFGAQCCTLAVSSEVFTPAAASTTQIPLSLPMRNDLNPAFGETVDYLALTVLARDVVVPVARVAGAGIGSIAAGATGSLVFAPQLEPGDVGSLSTGVGWIPLLNADLVGCASGPAGTPTDRCTGLALTLARRVPTLVQLARGAVLPAECVLAGPGRCVVVATAPRTAAARVTVGRGQASFTAGGRQTVRIAFTRSFRRALARRRRSLTIRLEATATVSAPIPATSKAIRTVTLRRGR